MKRFAEEHGFTFPYLYDESQDVARAYDAVCTPDFFGFNDKLELQYRGRLDASRKEAGPADARRELFEAMRASRRDGAGAARADAVDGLLHQVEGRLRLVPSLSRHGRARPGSSRFLSPVRLKTWMPGTRPGKTGNERQGMVAINSSLSNRLSLFFTRASLNFVSNFGDVDMTILRQTRSDRARLLAFWATLSIDADNGHRFLVDAAHGGALSRELLGCSSRLIFAGLAIDRFCWSAGSAQAGVWFASHQQWLIGGAARERC